MKIATVIVLILAIALGSVALTVRLNSAQSPLTPNNNPTGNVSTKVSDKELLASVSRYSMELGSLPLVETIEDGVYHMDNYSRFYLVFSDGFYEFEDVKSASVNAVISGETCSFDIRYVEHNGRVVGGGKYEKIIEQNGVYSVKLSLIYTLTEMPSALSGQEGEKLLLVGFASDDYYSEAFAVSLDDGNLRNLFSGNDRAQSGADGYVMLTDELIKQSDEHLYFFSTRRYSNEREKANFNPYKSIDLFRIKDGMEEFVAAQAHHNYAADTDDGSIVFVRSEYATLSYTVGAVPMTSFQEMNFEVISLNPDTMTETVLMESDDSYTSGYRRFGNWLVRMSPDHYGVVEIYDMLRNEGSSYSGMRMRTVTGFDVSDDGRYIAVGGSVSTVSAVKQSVCFIDTKKSWTVNLEGRDLFLSLNGNFGFIENGQFVNSNYNEEGTEITFYITKTDKIFKTFNESVED